jgi:kynurenine formamidase
MVPLRKILPTIIFLIFSQVLYAKTFVDLTHSFSQATLHWPTAKPFQLQKTFAADTPQGYYYAVNDFTTSEHVGTHVDAPIHFAKGHPTVSEIPLTKLIGAGVLIDMRHKTLKNHDYEIDIDDLKDWENKNGLIPSHSIVLLYTGFSDFWPNPKSYLGTIQHGLEGVRNLHFPGLAPHAARWLFLNREINSIGIDTLSIDFGQSKTFLTHQMLGHYNVPFFENVANLSQLPSKNFTIYALPMKIHGGTGAPLRIIAVINP